MIIFRKEHKPGVFVLNPSSRNVGRLRNEQLGLGMSYAAYGHGVVYIGKDKSYRYRNLKTGEDRQLKTGIDIDCRGFYYLSDRCLIYKWFHIMPSGDARMLDIGTSRSQVVSKMFAFSGDIAISPDMSRYSLWIGGIGESAVPKLYVGAFSKRVTKELADFGCAGDSSRRSVERNVYHP